MPKTKMTLTPQFNEQENELRFTLYVTTYGKKSKCVRDIGHALSRMCYLTFGNRYKLVDHRSQPIEYSPDDHDWGLGES